jgi:hypothetical protein
MKRELLPEKATAKKGTIGLHGGRNKKLRHSLTSRMIECSCRRRLGLGEARAQVPGRRARQNPLERQKV